METSLASSLPGLILLQLIPSLFEPSRQGRQVPDDKGWMGLLRWGNILLNPKMDFHSPALEPAASSSCKARGLCDLRDAKQVIIEGSGIILTASRHG